MAAKSHKLVIHIPTLMMIHRLKSRWAKNISVHENIFSGATFRKDQLQNFELSKIIYRSHFQERSATTACKFCASRGRKSAYHWHRDCANKN